MKTPSSKRSFVVVVLLIVAFLIVMTVLVASAIFTLRAVMNAPPSEVESALYQYCVTSIDAALVEAERAATICASWAERVEGAGAECLNTGQGFFECGLELPDELSNRGGMD